MKGTGQDLKGQFKNAVEHFKQMPKKKKIIIGSVVGLVLVLALGVTIFLNAGKNGYKVLYEGLESEEKSTIYSMLQEMGVSAQMNADGNITVPAKDYDRCLMELAIKGYPQSGMGYDLMENHTGMTTTESESNQWRIYQLQDRLQNTLKYLQPVKNAVVTINVPEQGKYVWETENDSQKSTAGVVLSLSENLTAQQVDGIKTLISSQVPNLLHENVKVVDAATSRELYGSTGNNTDSLSSVDNLTFEKQVQKQIEDNAERILAQRYGANGVVAVAKVELDYDKMLTEQMQLQPKEDGGGYVSNFSENYTLDGQVAAGGIVGEENNTDIPEQVVGDENAENGVTNYNRDIQYEYGYIKTQIEKGNAVLKNATISVMVDEDNMTQARRNELIALVSTSTGIAEENITVSPIDPDAAVEPDEELPVPTTQIVVPLWVWIVLGASLLILILAAVISIWLRKRAKRKQQQQQNEIDQQRAQMEQEIADYKKKLSDAAMAATDPKDEAIINEVKGFAKQHPEITANLLRAWLKEEGE